MGSRRKPFGYLVLNRGDGAGTYHIGFQRCLWLGGRHATVFPTRAAANHAIRTTMAYAANHGLSWSVDDYEVKALREAPVAK